jgi:hypothetical protein
MHTQTIERRLHRRDGPTGEPPRRHLEAMIIGTYREMPGLSLHLAQAARLFGLCAATCQIILDDLVRQGVLRVATDGQYVRPDQNR